MIYKRLDETKDEQPTDADVMNVKPNYTPNPLLCDVLSERQKRLLAYAGHFSGAYQSMCLSNPIKDLQDKTGFIVMSTDRNYDNTVVKFDNLKTSQKELLNTWGVHIA